MAKQQGRECAKALGKSTGRLMGRRWQRVCAPALVVTLLALGVPGGAAAGANTLPRFAPGPHTGGTHSRLWLVASTVVTDTICPVAGCPIAAPPDPTTYDGADPVNSTNKVVLFMHDPGGTEQDWWAAGNAMYVLAYNAGYRTAFVTLSTKPWRDAFTNSATLTNQIKTIVLHYGVRHVDVVTHYSKGGVNIQAAILKFFAQDLAPPLGNVMTLSTSHRGTYLADPVCFINPSLARQLGLPREFALCGAAGTQGVGELTMSGMAAFRQLFDNTAIVATLPITNYVAVGADWQDAPGLQFAGSLLPTSSKANNPLGGFANDGFVTAPSAYQLPRAHYLLVGAFDHFGMHVGHNVFRFIDLAERGGALVDRGHPVDPSNPNNNAGPAACALSPGQ